MSPELDHQITFGVKILGLQGRKRQRNLQLMILSEPFVNISNVRISITKDSRKLYEAPIFGGRKLRPIFCIQLILIQIQKLSVISGSSD